MNKSFTNDIRMIDTRSLTRSNFNLVGSLCICYFRPKSLFLFCSEFLRLVRRTRGMVDVSPFFVSTQKIRVWEDRWELSYSGISSLTSGDVRTSGVVSGFSPSNSSRTPYTLFGHGPTTTYTTRCTSVRIYGCRTVTL